MSEVRDLRERRKFPYFLLSKCTHLFFLSAVLIALSIRHGLFQKKSVVIPISGRLGNQLFQLAASVSIRPQVRNLYWIESTFSNDSDYRAELFSPTLNDVYRAADVPCQPSKEITVNFDCRNLLRKEKWPWGSCFKLIEPHFQCHEVARKGLPLVSSTLLNLSSRLNATRGFMTENFFGVELIAVHVRRGDYLMRFNRGLLEPLDVSYYATALLSKFPANSSVIVFSDDIKWCRKAFRRVGLPYRFHFMDIPDPLLALMVMASADHHIIANSTFSWWAAFLRDSLIAYLRPSHQARKQIVVAPKPWFGPAMVNTRTDMIPHHWIQINTTSESEITVPYTNSPFLFYSLGLE